VVAGNAAVAGAAVVTGTVRVLLPVTAAAVPADVAFEEERPGIGQVSPVLLQSVVAGTTVNFPEAVALWVTALTVTRYSSGVNVDVSTVNDQVFWPALPGITVTIPPAPEKPEGAFFEVGANEEDVISTIRLSPAARLVVPFRVKFSPCWISPMELTATVGWLTKNVTVTKVSSMFWLPIAFINAVTEFGLWRLPLPVSW
jgi:hypothetical protein